MVNDGKSLYGWINEKPLYERIISWTLLIAFVLFIILVELSQWFLIVRAMFNLFGLDYTHYAYLVPFEYMIDGENVSFVIAIAAIILAILIMIFLWGDQDVKMVIILFEILAIGIAAYIIVWVIAVYFVMVLIGLTFGKWTMIMAFLVAVLIHVLFFIVRKIAISLRP
ncbi:hypothetical protein MCP_2088 [Methanocella paludicola SANAE]|uniref:Uncharacterized protein n=1 Tax=Methanocella paludicola (strain DSM 17711 / JCM 13418 / NBRC 101707 / SANAE) TaxID=304371 RepID=D1Z0D8_METPS|nr:hypothetical protein [Methanocella paludicola]BAI62160.1 hypothetical protein MCP_2088 [Methanocella paludicola SANAE]